MSGCRKGDYEMTTANNIKGQNINNDLITALYCRLSVEDIKDDKNNKRRNIDESNSISNQKQIRVQALTVAILTVCNVWLRKVKSVQLS